MAYLLDSNVFIEAKNLYYGFDICPGFWNWLLAAHVAGQVFSIERVKQELTSRNDDLANWVQPLPASVFLQATGSDMPSLSTVSTQVATMGYEPAAVIHACARLGRWARVVLSPFAIYAVCPMAKTAR